MKVGYFTNQYPAVSHTFIRREIQAVEQLGVTVARYAVKPAYGKLLHESDEAELAKTRHIVQTGVLRALYVVARTAVRRLPSLITCLRLAIRMGWHSDRGLLRHIIYVVEGAVLAGWCKEDKVEHLHAHFGTNAAAIAMFASILSGVTYSFTAHGSEEFEKAPLLSLDTKVERAAFAVCVSLFGRAQLMRWCKPSQWHKIFCIHCGLDSQFLNPSRQPVPAHPNIICVGRLGEHKGQLLLVDAVKQLRDRGTYCELVLAGDGPMRPEIEAAINVAGLSDRISITGWISSEAVKEGILRARALILPSFSENMPVVIMEAMALGRPVISTYIAGIPELVQSGTNGWLVPSSDVEGLAAVMNEVLQASPEKLESMGAAGRARVLEQFNSLDEAGKLKGLFEKVIARGRLS